MAAERLPWGIQTVDLQDFNLTKNEKEMSVVSQIYLQLRRNSWVPGIDQQAIASWEIIVILESKYLT